MIVQGIDAKESPVIALDASARKIQLGNIGQPADCR
jgi:hypothetical protein